MFICKYCTDDPQLHTFRVYDDNETHTTFYSCIAESTDKNIEQIVYHIRGFLEEHHKTTKTWSWIIDSKNFCMEWHTLPLTIELIGLYKEYQSTITEIRLQHLNFWMRELLEMIVPFTNESFQNILKIE